MWICAVVEECWERGEGVKMWEFCTTANKAFRWKPSPTSIRKATSELSWIKSQISHRPLFHGRDGAADLWAYFLLCKLHLLISCEVSFCPKKSFFCECYGHLKEQKQHRFLSWQGCKKDLLLNVYRSRWANSVMRIFIGVSVARCQLMKMIGRVNGMQKRISRQLL